MPLAAPAARLVFTALLVTVSVFHAAEPAFNDSPTYSALTPIGYVPAAMPLRLTFDSDATPLPFVVALPAAAPFNVNATVLPESPEPLCVSVAESDVVPLVKPLADDVAMLVRFLP